MQKQFRYQNTRISYRLFGAGKPVVLLHGFGEDGHIWDEQIAFLQDHCLLIVPDLPGSGESERLIAKHQPSGVEEPVLMEDYADVILALLEEEKTGTCLMLGHSMGGYITLAFVEKYPQRVMGYGLIHSTAFADPDEKKQNREKAIELIQSYGPFPFLKNTIPNLFGERFKRISPEKINKLIEAAKTFSAETLQQYYRAMMLRPDRTHVLQSNRVPVIFVIGTEDNAAPMADLLKQVSLPRISYIYVLPETGHMGMWEATEQVNRSVLAFIQQT